MPSVSDDLILLPSLPPPSLPNSLSLLIQHSQHYSHPTPKMTSQWPMISEQPMSFPLSTLSGIVVSVHSEWVLSVFQEFLGLWKDVENSVFYLKRSFLRKWIFNYRKMWQILKRKKGGGDVRRLKNIQVGHLPSLGGTKGFQKCSIWMTFRNVSDRRKPQSSGSQRRFSSFGMEIQMWASSSVMGHGAPWCQNSGSPLLLSGRAWPLISPVTSWFKFTALAQATASIFMSTIVPVSERITRI